MTRTRDFWSTRRAAVQAEQDAEDRADSARQAETEQALLEAREDADILAELNLPDPDDLIVGDDIRGFMSKTVPDRLRRRALRRLWRLNPVLANVDGLVDYGEDFTDSATVLENLQTTYQVGKGMLAHIEEIARQEEKDQTLDEDAQEDDTSPDQSAEKETPETMRTLANSQTDAAPLPEWSDCADPADKPVPEGAPDAWTPRRMRFEFSSDTAAPASPRT